MCTTTISLTLSIVTNSSIQVELIDNTFAVTNTNSSVNHANLHSHTYTFLADRVAQAKKLFFNLIRCI